MSYSLERVGFAYGESIVLQDVSAAFDRTEVVAILGPNGAGKSTLLSVLAGLRPEYLGNCAYRGKEVRRWPRRAFAREVSFVPQSLRLEFPFTAGQVALMGRTPHCDQLFESPDDIAAVDLAMEITDTTAFRERDFRSLSGGERQRVVLAAALAQSPRVLLLDEPTTFLDLKHQLAIYALLRDLARQGILVITVTHDLNLAATYADRVILLRGGRLVADGPPAEALSAARIREVFEVAAEVWRGPGERPWIVYGS